MKSLILFLALIFSLTFCAKAQSDGTQAAEAQTTEEQNAAIEKIILISDLKALETRTTKVDAPLAKASAKAEVADAAWTLDRDWAKKLLREAYELTLPDEEEQEKLRNIPAGSMPPLPNSIDRARGDIRNRVLDIARRDKDLASQLAQLGIERLGKFEGHFRGAVLAREAFQAGDKESARQYLLQSIEADPTQITAASVINIIAAEDRALADRLILQYIERLRTFPLSNQNQSDSRTFYLLAELIRYFRYEQKASQPPSPAVMKAYVSYMIESLSQLEQSAPGYLQRARPRLLSVWPLVQQYAPELTGAFMDLERRSRRSGDDASLPPRKSLEDEYKDRYEKRAKEALDSNQPDETTINAAISRGDFVKARKMIDKLTDGPRKEQLTEMINEKESLSLAEKGYLPEAISLAEKLNTARSILSVYPALLRKCVANKDRSCAISLVYQAIKQLNRADTKPPTPPAGIPASVFATNQEFDPVLSSLAKLSLTILPLNETLAFEVLDETIAAANVSPVDTGQGRVGFDVSVFKKLAPKNETRVRQAAESFKDPLRQIVALAVIYQWKAEELTKKETGKDKAKQ